jgi:hypothetical protein
MDGLSEAPQSQPQPANHPHIKLPHPLPADPFNLKTDSKTPTDVELEVQLVRDIKVGSEKCTSYAPAIFKKLREIHNISNTVYKVSVNTNVTHIFKLIILVNCRHLYRVANL